MPQPDAPAESPLKKLLPFTAVGVIIAALYVAWTFYSRHQSEVLAQQQIASSQQESRQRVVEQVFGNGEIKFTAFAAGAGLIAPGEKTELCYGVMNATTVTMDPPIEPLKPTYHHCIEIAPVRTTTYTITASDGKGQSQSHSLTIRVK
jgi:hypothetical protein